MSQRILFIAFCCLPMAALAQQNNTPLAGFSVNGTGALDGAGTPLVTNAMVQPTPVGSAPIFHHDTAPGTSLELRITGTPGLPILLLAGDAAAVGLPVGTELMELTLSSTQVVLNGLNPVSIFDFSAYIGPQGAWRFYAPNGLHPATINKTSLQGLVSDPTFPPFNVRFTSSVTVEAKNDIDTLARNFADALLQTVENPLYLSSLASSGFLLEGLDIAQFTVIQSASMLGLSGDESPVTFIDLKEIGPAATNMPPLPTGAPTTGQVTEVYVDAFETFAGTVGPNNITMGERFRWFGLKVVEQSGIWKIHGDQRDVLVESEVNYLPHSSNANSVECRLQFFVEEMLGANGGIASVTLTGPQLAGLTASGQSSVSTGVGTISFDLDASGGPGSPSCWEASVMLNQFGSPSRLPMVEIASGPRDTYDILVTWNDGSTSGPYSSVLRATIDAFANPSQARAAIPGGGIVAPTAALFNAGTPNTVVDITFPLGILPSAADFGAMGIYVSQNAAEFDAWDLYLPPTPAIQTLSFYAPGFVAGTTNLFLANRDRFGASYNLGFQLNL